MTTTRTVLIAPDKFKGTLTAAQVVAALAAGIARTAPQLEVLSCPIADGGDGTVDAALAAGYEEHHAEVTGPTGEPWPARWAQQGEIAVLELAGTVGLHALPGGTLAPRTASTRGLGELIHAAIDAGARRLLVGLGGSSSTDAGAGLLQGLGARLLDKGGAEIGPGLDGLAALHTADLTPALAAMDGIELVAANDVTNPLLGADGAAAVYGPQKGLSPEEVGPADEILAAAASLLDPDAVHRDLTGAGAAGGAGFALSLLGAAQRSGADAVFALIGFSELLARADAVVTGEGKLDSQTLQGKGPAEVARLAREKGVPVAAVAGAVTLEPDALGAAGIGRAWDLITRAGSFEVAVADGERLLTEIGEELGRWLVTAAEQSAQPTA